MATTKKPVEGEGTEVKKGPADKAEVKKTATRKPADAKPATAKKPAAAKTEAPKADAAKEKNQAAAQVKTGPSVAKRSAHKEAAEMNDPEVKLENALGRTEQYLHDNGKKMLTILVVILLIVVAFLAYKYVHTNKRPQKAGAAMYVAEQMFKEDSFDLALNGDGNNAGFLRVIEDFSSTPQGNIARHYAGVCYFHLGELDNAAKYLAEYKPAKGIPAEIINAQNKGLQGDIRVQQQKYEEAARLYIEAVDASNNSFTAPHYLRKLALVYDKLGQSAKAIDTFQRMVDDYPTSADSRDALKYLGDLEQRQ